MATKKQPIYRVVRATEGETEGEELTAKQLGDALEARLADGSIVAIEDTPLKAPAERAATTVVGDNGTITATVQ